MQWTRTQQQTAATLASAAVAVIAESRAAADALAATACICIGRTVALCLRSSRPSRRSLFPAWVCQRSDRTPDGGVATEAIVGADDRRPLNAAARAGRSRAAGSTPQAVTEARRLLRTEARRVAVPYGLGWRHGLTSDQETG